MVAAAVTGTSGYLSTTVGVVFTVAVVFIVVVVSTVL